MGETRAAALYFLTPVWGEAYTRVFLDVALPCQLAARNLPGLCDRDRCRYLVFTTPRDAEVIAGAPAFRALGKTLPVQIILIEEEIGIPHETMTACFRRGISMADDQGAASVFLTPDLALADGALTAIQRMASQGWRVVYMTGIRLVKQPTVRALREKFLAGEAICVSPRDLMRIALQNLHPLALSSFWEEGDDDLLPTNLFWRVGSEGILARCFHLHPVLVLPERKHVSFFGTIDDDYIMACCPDRSRDYILRDSDELLGVELSDLSRYTPTGMRKGSIEDVALWAEGGANSRHRALIDVPIRLHTGIADEAAWRAAERKSAAVVSDIKSLVNRSALRLLFVSPRTLERRLLLKAQERQLERRYAGQWGRELPDGDQASTGQQKAASRLAALDARTWALLRSRLQTRCVSLARATIEACLRLRVPSPFLMEKCLRFLKRVRARVLGAPEAPNILNPSWIYCRELARDLKRALATLEPNPVVCADPDHSVLARICSGRRAARFGVLHTQAGHGGGQAGTSLYDLRTGAAFGGGSLDSIIVEANLRQCSDLADLLHEVGRVLKEGGLVAIKVDRLPNAMQVMASEVCVSSGALCSALRPGFRIVWQGRQGRIGTALVVSLVSYLKGQMTRLKLPFAAVFFWVLLRMPLEMLLGVSANLLGLVLNVLDTTDRNYVSSIVVARKTGGAAGTPGQAGPAWSWSPAGHRNISG